MRLFPIVMVATLALLSVTRAQTSKQKPSMPQQGSLKVGDAAPGFVVKDVDGRKTVKLSDLKGKPVVLIFGSCT